MKKIIISSLFLTFSFCAIAQDATEDYYTTPLRPKAGLLSQERITTSIMAGTSVSFSNNKNSSVSTFIAPKISYQLTEKFKLNLGLAHFTSHPTLLSNKSEGCFTANKKNSSADYLFVGGEYQLNKKIIVSGAIMASTNSLTVKQNNYKAVEIGMDYKVSKHSSIGIRAVVSDGNSNSMFDQGRNSNENRPFNNNSFGNGFTGIGEFGSGAFNNPIR